jgi:hypothetical protein
MKIEFTENEWGVWFEVRPETPEEVSQLARYALNASSEKPEVYMTFDKAPQLTVSHQKRKEKKRSSINPKMGLL